MRKMLSLEKFFANVTVVKHKFLLACYMYSYYHKMEVDYEKLLSSTQLLVLLREKFLTYMHCYNREQGADVGLDV